MKRKFDSRWLVVAGCFLMVFICLGFCSSNKSLYLSAITDALDIKRSLFSINDSCRFLTSAVIAAFFGPLVARFGIKKLIVLGFASLIASMLIYAHATSIYAFYVGGCLLGLGISFTTTTMVGTVVRRHFRENSGKIMGAALAANGLGGALAAQIVAPIIFEEGNPFGYRNAYTLVAVILAITAVIVLCLVRDNKEAGPHEAKKAKKTRGQGWTGIDFATARKRPYFYFSIFAIFMTGLVLQGVNGISGAHMKDVGLDSGYVATVLSVHSLALTGFKFLTGYMYDKYGVRKTAMVCDVTAIVVTLMLGFLTNSPAGMFMAMFYGFFSSLALPLETIMLPLFAIDLFGNKSYEKMLGLFVAFNTAGYACGSPMVNWCYDLCGSYKPMLIIYAGVMLIITIGFQFILKAAQKERATVEAAEAAAETAA